MYLFLFLFLYSFSSFSPDLRNLYEVAFSTFILIKIYKEMIFPSSAENKQFFTGFFALAVLSLVEFLARSTRQHLQLRLGDQLIMSPFIIMLGYTLICYKSKKLMKSSALTEDSNLLKNPGVLSHFIEETENKIRTSYGCFTFFKEHTENCCSLSCFCRKYYDLSPTSILEQPSRAQLLRREILDNLYQHLLTRQSNCQESNRQQSLNEYFLFLIKNGQLTRMMQTLFQKTL